MYAVIATGGKQYRISQGDVIRVEKLDGDEGASVDFDRVLMIGDGDDVTVGTPYIDGGVVSGTIKTHGRGKKIEVIKFRRRKNYRKQMGHRQAYTEIEITDIKTKPDMTGSAEDYETSTAETSDHEGSIDESR